MANGSPIPPGSLERRSGTSPATQSEHSPYSSSLTYTGADAHAAPAGSFDVRPWRLLAIAFAIAGVALRVREYLDRQSLWLDEVRTAINLAARSYLGLARPLDYAQPAPLGFLWAERAIITTFGPSELAFRTLPFIASCAAVGALWMLARRLIGERGAAFAVALAALSPLLIEYGDQTKSYASDALVTIALLWLLLDVHDAPDSASRWRRLLLGGVAAIFFSTSAVFVLAAAVCVVPLRRGRQSFLAGKWLVAASASWLLTFGVFYFTLYRGVAHSDYMQRAWWDDFLPLSPAVVGTARRVTGVMLRQTFFALREAAVPPVVIPATALLIVIGMIAMARRRGAATAGLLVVPFIAVAVASFAHRWPLAPRLLVFLIPIAVALLAAGIDGIASWLPRRVGGTVAVAISAVLLARAMTFDANEAYRPYRRDDVAPLITSMMSSRADSALVYVIRHAAPSWLFYTTPWRDSIPAWVAYAVPRANTYALLPRRGCVHQAPGLRTVYAAWTPGMYRGPFFAREAEWLIAQPERELWVVILAYEAREGDVLDRELSSRGATRTEALVRGDATLRRYRLPGQVSGATHEACEGDPR